MTLLKKDDKVKFNGDHKGRITQTLTRDTVINGKKYEASAARPMVRVVDSSGHASVQDPKKITKL